jgi:hypothetical protein
MSDRETPLADVSAIPPNVVKQLAARWITSAEQLVALGGSEERVKALSEQLGLTRPETTKVLDAAATALDPATAESLRRPVDINRYRTGARQPKPSSDGHS